MDKDYLILKGASASRPSGEWNNEDRTPTHGYAAMREAAMAAFAKSWRQE